MFDITFKRRIGMKLRLITMSWML